MTRQPKKISADKTPAPFIGLTSGAIIGLIAIWLDAGPLRNTLTILAAPIAVAITTFSSTFTSLVSDMYQNYDRRKTEESVERKTSEILADKNMTDEHKQLAMNKRNSAKVQSLLRDCDKLNLSTAILSNKSTTENIQNKKS